MPNWSQTISKPKWERILKEWRNADPIEVSDITGDSKLEVNTLKPPVEEEPHSESSKKNDTYQF